MTRPTASSATPALFDRLLLTGAAGGLGRELRRRLKACCRMLRLSDIADLGVPAAGEELMPAALENADAMLAPRRRASKACGASCSQARTT